MQPGFAERLNQALGESEEPPNFYSNREQFSLVTEVDFEEGLSQNAGSAWTAAANNAVDVLCEERPVLAAWAILC